LRRISKACKLRIEIFSKDCERVERLEELGFFFFRLRMNGKEWDGCGRIGKDWKDII